MDVFRALSCLAVIIIHTSAGPVSTLQAGSIHLFAMTLINSITRFAVPGFIFLSGFSLTYVYQKKGVNESEKWARNFTKILLPYLVWSLVYYFVCIRLGYYGFSWFFLLEKLVLGDMFYHLYFVVLICQFYLLFKVINWFFGKFKPEILLFIMFLINVIFMKKVYFKYIDRFFLQYLFFFGLGCYWALKRDEVKKRIIRIKNYLIGIYLTAVLYYTYRFYQSYVLKLPVKNINLLWFIFCTISVLFFYYLSLWITEKGILVDLLQKISISSYHIYLSHPLVLLFSQLFLERLGYTSIMGSFLINTSIIFFIVVPFSIYYSKNKLIARYKNWFANLVL